MSQYPDGLDSKNGTDLLDLIRKLALKARSQFGMADGMPDDECRGRIKKHVQEEFFNPSNRDARELVGLYVEDVLVRKALAPLRPTLLGDGAESNADALARLKVQSKAGSSHGVDAQDLVQGPKVGQPKPPLADSPSWRTDAQAAPTQQLEPSAKGPLPMPVGQPDPGASKSTQHVKSSSEVGKSLVDQNPKKAGLSVSMITQKEIHSCKPGRLNVSYSEPLPSWVAKMRERAVDGLPDGVRMSVDGSFLEGVPVIHGEIKAVIKGRKQDGTPIELTLHIPILPDPKALWKSYPSDQDGKFPKPDADGEHFVDERLGVEVLAASVRGRSHAQKGAYRDDDYIIRSNASGWVIVATADGAGSAEFSRRGSQLAVKHASVELENRLREAASQLDEAGGDESRIKPFAGQCMFKAVQAAVAAIEREAQDEGVSDSSFSTTLILVAARRCGARWLVLSFGIGDGGAAIWNDHAKVVVPLTKGDSGEFAGQTRFLRRNEVESLEHVVGRTKVVLVDRPSAILSMTDGITDPKFETDSLFESAEHWQGFWRNDFFPMLTATGDARLRDRLLAWMEFWSPGNHDDRTLAAILFDLRG